VEVVVKDMSDGAEITVKVPATASLRQVKNAVVQLLGRSDLADAGTFVEKDGDGMTSLTDAETLGDRRCLLMLGMRLVPLGRHGDAESSHPRSSSKSVSAQPGGAALKDSQASPLLEPIPEPIKAEQINHGKAESSQPRSSSKNLCPQHSVATPKGSLGAQSKTEPVTESVEVVIKHPFKNREDKVFVSSLSTVQDLRTAILNKHVPSHLTAVRLATRSGNTFKWFKDDDALGSNREFVVTGLTLLDVDQHGA